MRGRKEHYLWLLPLLLVLCPLLVLALPPPSAKATASPADLSSLTTSSHRQQDHREAAPYPQDLVANQLRSDDQSLPPFLLLDFSSYSRSSNTSRLLQDLCSKPTSERKKVQQCNVFGYASLGNWTEIEQGLRCLPNMTDIYWQNFAPMPRMKTFFENKLPNVRLHLDMQGRYDRYNRTHVTESDFTCLSGSRNIRTLKLHIQYDSKPETERITAFEHLLATCPNLQDLELTFEHQGCVDNVPQPPAFNFERRPLYAAKLAALRRLKLHGYDFGCEPDGLPRWMWYRPSPQHMLWPFTKLTSRQLRWYVPSSVSAILRDSKGWLYSGLKPSWLTRLYEGLTGDSRLQFPAPCTSPCCEPPAGERNNIEVWMASTSFDNITALDLDYIDYTAVTRVLPSTKSLRNLTIHCSGWDPCARDALFRYIQKPHAPFTALHVAEFNRHRASLMKYLEALVPSKDSLHALTIPSCYEPSPSKLEHMSKLLPHLTTLDMHQARSLPLLTSKINSTHFPSLQFLTIHVATSGRPNDNLSSGDMETPLDILFNKTSLESQFSSMPSSLTRVELVIGPWAFRDENSMAGPANEIIGRYVCTREASASKPLHDDTEVDQDVQCSGGLRLPGPFEQAIRYRRLVEGPKGHAVLNGEIGQDTKAGDEEGRKAGLGRWVQWRGVHGEPGVRFGDVDYFGKVYGVDEDWGCWGKCDGSDKTWIKGRGVVMINNTDPGAGFGSRWKPRNDL